MQRKSMLRALSVGLVMLGAPLTISHRGLVANSAYACDEEDQSDCGDEEPGGFTCCAQTAETCSKYTCGWFTCAPVVVQRDAYYVGGSMSGPPC